MTHRAPFHSDLPRQRAESALPAVEAYLDARGAGRAAKSMLDEVGRDASVLNDLARDREWIEQMRSSAPAPDQTDRILGRLGVDPARFDCRRHRLALLSRRFSAAAAFALAFVVGMWMRSSIMLPPASGTAETAHRFERVIESLPIQVDPFVRMRGIMLDVSSSLVEPESPIAPAAQADPPARTAPRQAQPHPPVRAAASDSPRSEGDASDLIDEEIDIESLKAIYRDLGIV